MSCFVVSNKHINTLVAYAAEKGLSVTGVGQHPAGYPEQWGQWLFEENCRAYKERYGHRDDFEAPTGYAYEMEIVWCSPVQIIKLARCYRYQLAEFDGWEDTPAARLALDIIEAACSELPGYEEAAWEI